MNALSAKHPANITHAIQHPTAPCNGPCWLLFRNTFTLEQDVKDITIYVSGSQRVVLYLDGEALLAGPPRSDRERWEVMQLTLPMVKAGRHTLCAEVVHYGEYAGKGQIGGKHFLLLACDSLTALNSDSGQWSVHHDHSRKPNLSEEFEHGHHHYAIGPGEVFRADAYPWSWQSPVFDASEWLTPEVISEPNGNPWGNRSLGCKLISSTMPQMRQVLRPWTRVLDEYGTETSFGKCTVAPHQKITRIYDAGAIINALPTVQWTHGHHAKINIIACESPYPADGIKKNRDEISDCDLPGQADVIEIGEGVSTERSWSPRWMRSFRYYKVIIQTQSTELTFYDPVCLETSFPLQTTLACHIQDPANRDWDALIKVNRQTVISCSHETIMDCPAWEQAQFPGDARIVARHHYLVSNEDRLALKAINDFAASRVDGGLLRSHWPSAYEQVIATYSLQWIGMLEDWRLYRGKGEAILHHLPTARGILDWFMQRVRPDGLLGRIDEAPFVDWAFHAGCPVQDDKGGSSILTALLAETLQMMARLEQWIGYPELVNRWNKHAAALLQALDQCWDPEQQLLKDAMESDSFSVHAQVQAALAGYWGSQDASRILKKALDDPEVIKPQTLYYRAHLMHALRQLNLQPQLYPLFDDWFQMLKRGGITTWPESDNNPRSDCHGWGCTPEIELVHCIAGLTPISAGFSKAGLAPYLGDLQSLKISLKLPAGLFTADYDSGSDGHIHVRLTTPIPLILKEGSVLTTGQHQIVIA